MNLLALPELRAAQNPEGPTVADDTVSLDNAEFLQAVRRASANLHSHGVSGGDVVAVMLPNTASFVVALFAAWRLGAAVTPINPSLRPAEVIYQLADADAKVLIVDTVPDFDIGAQPVITAIDLASTPATGRSGCGTRCRRFTGAADLHQRHHRPAQGRDARPLQFDRDVSRRDRRVGHPPPPTTAC